MDTGDEIICERRGQAGLVTLNRPRALNALTHAMVRALRAALDAWSRDPEVTRIVIRGAGGRVFCAGGDIRAIHALGLARRFPELLGFFRDEYALNHLVHTYPKPYVALIDGIVMGGGVGVSLHGSHCVAGARYSFAMPEVGIGFFPDVGATYALPRLPGGAGRWLALTGERIGPADALALGLAQAHVPSEAMEGLCEALCAGEPVDEAIAARRTDPGPPALAPRLAGIEPALGQHSLAAIVDALRGLGAGFAAETLAAMAKKSPTSLHIAFEQMRRGGGLDFIQAMQLEYRIVSRILEGHDFYEGVRAVLIDKDAPRWNPASMEAVELAAIEAHFAPLGPAELTVPG